MDDHKQQLSKNPEKGVLIGIFFLALFAAIFGIIRMRQYLYQPVPQTSGVASQVSPVLSSEINDALALQAKDTDGDEISDYDELNRYRTSPYLTDTDSDGFLDKQEIVSGNDPNCPAGKTCAGSSAPLVLQAPLFEPVPSFSPEALRDTLRKNGLNEEQIAALDDAALKQLYDETVKDVAAPLSETPPVVAPPSPLDFFQNVTTAELRAILKENGVSESDLSAIDDATLRAFILERIKEKTP